MSVSHCPLCQTDRVRFFCREDQIDLLKCAECGLIFAWPMHNQMLKWEEDILPILENENLSHYTHCQRKPIFENFFDSPPIKTKKGRVLDVGCQDGHFLTVANQAGWVAVGVEPASNAARVAQRRGIEVYEDLFSERLPPCSFDLATFWDSLEHMQDPLSNLKRSK